MRNSPFSAPTSTGHFAVNIVMALNAAVSTKKWCVPFTPGGFHCRFWDEKCYHSSHLKTGELGAGNSLYYKHKWVL